MWPRAYVGRMQYRVYYEVNGGVFADGILRQLSLPVFPDLRPSPRTPSASKNELLRALAGAGFQNPISVVPLALFLAEPRNYLIEAAA